MVNGGIAKVAPQQARASAMSKPQLPSTRSPWISFLRNPLFTVICLSDARPPQHLDTNIIAPVGLIAIGNFTVLWLL